MQKLSSSLILGAIFLLLFVGNVMTNSNSYSFNDIFLNIFIGAFGFLLLLYGIFNRFEYYNKTHYRIIGAAGLIAILLLIYSLAYNSVFEGNTSLNILFIVLSGILIFLVIGTRESTRWMDKKNKWIYSTLQVFKQGMESCQDLVMSWNLSLIMKWLLL